MHMKPPPEFTFRRRLVLLRILQIHPQRFINAQVVLRDIAEELALVHDLVRGGEGAVVRVFVALVVALGVFDQVNRTLSPTDEIMDKCEFFRDIPEDFLTVYEALWMDLKNTK